MPALSRRTGKLLRQVDGKQYASSDDHEEALPTPPATNSTRSSTSHIAMNDIEEDMNRDPESSDDEGAAAVQRNGATGFALPRQLDGEDHRLPKPVVFQKPISASPSSAESKRSNGSEPFSSDTDAGIFSSQGSVKRQKMSYNGNIHAPRKPHSKRYGRIARQSSQGREKRPGFKEPRKEPTKPEEPAAGPTFKTARGADMFEFGKTDTDTRFHTPKTTEDVFTRNGANHEALDPLSPSLSSLSSAPDSPEVEEVEHLNLPSPKPYIPTTECAMCGQNVDLFLKEDFENEFTQGKLMSYKWQQRFCRYHKQYEAQLLWKQRGYPEIDWSGLDKRMRRHHSHLKNVMSGARPSHYRQELSERLQERSKTALQTVNSDRARQGGLVGYYGPRGEKMMTDHIIAHLSDSLRKQAAKDKLVAASGVSGGVSGFVQAVLVPELAEQLVREDMKVSGDIARGIVAESADLGDLLNPEVDEKVMEVIELDE